MPDPRNMLPQVIICERTSRWAVAWRRALRNRAAIVEARSVSSVDNLLSAERHQPIAVDAAAFSFEQLLPGIARWSQLGSPVVVLGSPALFSEELVFREAGAVHAVFSLRQVPAAAEMLLRYAQKVPKLFSSAEPPLEQAIYERLPWSRYSRADA